MQRVVPTSRLPSRHRRSKKPFLEILEDRTLLAVFDIQGAAAFYRASAGVANRITLDQVGTNLKLTDAAELITVSTTAQKAGCTGNGTNTISCPIAALSAIQIDTVDGLDSVTIKPSSPTFLSLAVTILNREGATDLSVDDSLDLASRTVILSADSLSGLGQTTIAFDPAHLHSLSIAGGADNNSYLIENTPAAAGNNVPTTLLTGKGSDTVSVLGTTGPLDIEGVNGRDQVVLGSQAPSLGGTTATLHGSVHVGNAGSLTDLAIDASSGPFQPTVTSVSGAVIGLAPAPITYTVGQLGSLTLLQGPRSLPAEVDGSLALPTETDIFPITVPAGGNLDITVGPRNGSHLESRVALYNSGQALLCGGAQFTTGGLVAVSEELAANSSGLVHLSQYVQPGKYVLAMFVSKHVPQHAGDYTLRADFAASPPPPAAPPPPPRFVGHTLATAALVDFQGRSSVVVNGFLSHRSDVDLYSLQLAPGDTITAAVDTQASGSGLDTALRVFAANGQPIASNNNYAGLDPAVSFQAAVAGTYYIGVSQASNQTYDPDVGFAGDDTVSGLYELTLTRSQARLAPDLIGASFQLLQPTAVWHSTVTVSYTIENRGGAASKTTGVDLLLDDTNRFLDDTNRFTDVVHQLAQFMLGPLAPGASAHGAVRVPLPSLADVLDGYQEPETVYLGLQILGARPFGVASGPSPAEGNDWSELAILVPTTAMSGRHATTATAQPLGLNARISGTLSSNQPVFYKLTLPMESTDTEGELTARVHALGTATRLTLYDGQGIPLVSNDGQSLTNPDDLLVQHVSGPHNVETVYYLKVESLGGKAGSFTLTTQFQSAFAPADPVLLSDAPITTLTGDYNGDGIADVMVVASSVDGGEIIPALGLGDGTFHRLENFTFGPSNFLVNSAVQGDLNGDGILDLAIAGTSAGKPLLFILLGNDDGTFRVLPSLKLPTASTLPMVIGDFNGDGKLDLGMGGVNGQVAILLGNGDDTFKNPHFLSLVFPALETATADFNGDGFDDLAVQDSVPLNGNSSGAGHLSVYLSNGDGTFAPPICVPLAALPSALTVGDFNGDGIPDLVTVTHTNQVAVLLGNGDGTFGEPLTSALAQPAGSGDARTLTVADFNNDGRLDLVVGNLSSTTLTVLLGNGDGTFATQTPVTADVTPTDVLAGDWTGDGRVDLAVATNNPANAPAPSGIAGSVTLLPGLGNGSFQNQVPLAAGDLVQGAVTADFNGDGIPDIAAVSAGSDDVAIFLGVGDGTFAPAQHIPVGQTPTALVAGDFNGDGRIDLAVLDSGDSTPDIQILLGVGDGTFREVEDAAGNPRRFPAGSFPNSLVAADFNGDGNLDLATANSDTNTVTVLYGRGDGTFGHTRSFPTVPGPHELVAGDFNGDGQTDLAMLDTTGQGYYGSPLASGGAVLLGTGKGAFKPPVTFKLPANSAATAMVVGDFDKNGDLDLAVATITGYPGYGYGYLGSYYGYAPLAATTRARSHPTLASGSGYSSSPYGGYGGSGTGGAYPGKGTIAVLLGNGDGTFKDQAPPTFAFTDGAPTGMVAGDFTGDGNVDLAVTSYSGYNYASQTPGSLTVLLGDGTGSLKQGQTIPFAQKPVDVITGDFNNDHIPDLLTINDLSVSVFLGAPAGGFLATPAAAHPVPLNPVPVQFADGSAGVVTLNSRGDLLFRPDGQQPGTFDPPVTINPGDPVRDFTAFMTGGGDQLAGIGVTPGGGEAGYSIVLMQHQVGGTIPLASGALPVRITSGDLTGDGLGDLILLNSTGTITVFRQIPGDQFLKLPDQMVAVGLSDLAVVNLPGDPHPDLLLTNESSGQVMILRGKGDGTFVVEAPLAAGADPDSTKSPDGTPGQFSQDETTAVAVGDLNHDGRPDLVTANSGSDTFSVLLGEGHDAFVAPQIFPAGDLPSVVRVADLNGDDLPDLAILDQDSVAIFLNDGHGGFREMSPVPAGSSPTGLTVTDINGDGIPDLLVTDGFGDLLKLLGNGDGEFHEVRDPHIALAVPTNNQFVFGNQAQNQAQDEVAVKDSHGSLLWSQDSNNGINAPGAVQVVNVGGGKQALIVANSGANQVLVYLGNSDGTFDAGPLQAYFAGTEPVGVTIADVNGDGIPDVLVANRGSNDVSVFFGHGQGLDYTLNPGPRLQVGAGPVATTVTTAANGQEELIVTNSLSNDVWILPSRGQGFFSDLTPAILKLPVGTDPQQALVLPGSTGSGSELVVINAGSDSVTSFTNFLNPSRTRSDIGTGGELPMTAVVGDFLKTGSEELLVANEGDGSLSLLQEGATGFTPLESFSLPDVFHPTALAMAPNDTVYVADANTLQAIPVAFPESEGPPTPPPITPPATLPGGTGPEQQPPGGGQGPGSPSGTGPPEGSLQPPEPGSSAAMTPPDLGLQPPSQTTASQTITETTLAVVATLLTVRADVGTLPAESETSGNPTGPGAEGPVAAGGTGIAAAGGGDVQSPDDLGLPAEGTGATTPLTDFLYGLDDAAKDLAPPLINPQPEKPTGPAAPPPAAIRPLSPLDGKFTDLDQIPVEHWSALAEEVLNPSHRSEIDVAPNGLVPPLWSEGLARAVDDWNGAETALLTRHASLPGRVLRISGLDEAVLQRPPTSEREAPPDDAASDLSHRPLTGDDPRSLSPALITALFALGTCQRWQERDDENQRRGTH
jgi:hypothetical protein